MSNKILFLSSFSTVLENFQVHVNYPFKQNQLWFFKFVFFRLAYLCKEKQILIFHCDCIFCVTMWYWSYSLWNGCVVGFTFNWKICLVVVCKMLWVVFHKLFWAMTILCYLLSFCKLRSLLIMRPTCYCNFKNQNCSTLRKRKTYTQTGWVWVFPISNLWHMFLL